MMMIFGAGGGRSCSSRGGTSPWWWRGVTIQSKPDTKDFHFNLNITFKCTFYLYSGIFSIPLSFFFFSLRPAYLHTLSIMCETRRSEMPGQDSSARLKAFSSSSMAPIPPPHALLFSFSWRADRLTLNSTTYRAYHSLLHFTAALSTATVIKNDSVRVTVRIFSQGDVWLYTRGESLRWECWAFLPLWRWERPALTDIVTSAASLPFLLPVKQIQSKTLHCTKPMAK